MELSEVVLHPVRMRIVRRFLGDRRLTTADLAAELGDVPVATLYRHVRVLVEHGVLDVADVQRVRGAAERTLVLGRAVVGPEDAGAVSAEQLASAFSVFLAGLAEDFDAYLQGGEVDPVADRVGFRELGLHLDDEELDGMLSEMSAVVARYAGRAPGGARVLRVLSTVLLPRPAG